MMRLTVLLATALVMSLAAAACGGGSDESSDATLDGAIAEANAICAAASREQPSEATAAVTTGGEAISAAEDALADLGEVSVPSEDQETWDSWLALTEQYVERQSQAIAAVEGGDDDGYYEIQTELETEGGLEDQRFAAAEELGFENEFDGSTCAEPIPWSPVA